MNIGYVTRTNGKVPIRVLRGYNPESSMGTHRSAPVKSGQTIYSGQLISLEWVSANSRYEWIVGGPESASTAAWNASTAAPLLYFALTDSSKEDVVASSSLIGLPCSGDYVIQTPYFFGTGSTFNEGLYVTYAHTTDDAAAPGTIKLVTAFETAHQPIVGQVTLIHGAEDVVSTDISAGLSAQEVVTIRTMFLPNLADAT